MSDNYVIEEVGRIDAEEVLKDVNNLKDLAQMEFIDDNKNIILLKKQFLMLLKKVNELEAELKSLRKRIK